MRDYPLNFFLQPMKPAKPPKTVSGQKTLEKAFESELYVAEEKIDGCRYFAIGGRIFSPRISDVDGIPVEKTQQLPHISGALRKFGSNLILDGEVYYPGGKAQDVITVTGSLPDEAIAKQERSGNWLRYMVFDVLRDAKGNWLTNLPWYRRREYLEQLFCELGEKLEEQGIDLTLTTIQGKRQYLDELLGQGKEGVVLKNIGGKYLIGKRPAWNWIKCKVEMEDDVVIMGFEPPEKIYTGKYVENWIYWGRRADGWCILPEGYASCNIDYASDEIIVIGPQPGPEWYPVTKYYAKNWIGSIVFGKYDKEGNLVRLGTCSGMDEAMRERFSKSPEAYIGKVARVKLMEYTRDGAYRHCSFVAIHSDKNPRECVIGG
jgi:ATP-dependent DNA ligase